MYFVYKVTAVLDNEEKVYIGLTRNIIERIESHKKSARFKNNGGFMYELLLETNNIAECLKREFTEIDTALGGRKPDGNRENFEGSCLNRSSVASIPLANNQHLCYSGSRGFFIK